MAADTKRHPQESGSLSYLFLSTAAGPACLLCPEGRTEKGRPFSPSSGGRERKGGASLAPQEGAAVRTALHLRRARQGRRPFPLTAAAKVAFRGSCWERRHSPAPAGGTPPFQVHVSGSPKPRFPKWKVASARPSRSSPFPAHRGWGPGDW